jgi:uncharacterized glyoxalase superfamily protein PhnB
MTVSRPNGWPTVVPRIFTEDVGGVVGFLKSVFGANGDVRAGAPSEVWLGNSVILVSDGGGARQPSPSFLYVHVEDVDGTFQRAIVAGAIPVEEPALMPYGDRRATVRDPWGNSWQIAAHGLLSEK